MALFPELKVLSEDDLFERFRKRRLTSLRSRSSRDLLCDEIAFELVSRSPKSVARLIEMGEMGDELKYRSVLCALSSIRAEYQSRHLLSGIRRMLLSAFDDRRPMVKAETFAGFGKLKIKIKYNDVVRCLASRTPYLACMALEYLCNVYPRFRNSAIQKAVKSRYAVLREAALDLIGDYKLLKFIPVAEALSRDRSYRVRQAAAYACSTLSA